MALALVNIFALGGTIAMAAPTPGRKPAKGKTRPPRGTVAPKLTARALVAAVPGLARTARIKTVDFSRVPGAHITDSDLVDLARAILAGRRPAVVVQGTDTIEETAFALDLLVGAQVPVVVTGAMRHPGMAGADGPANLLAAVTVAASPKDWGRWG
jgi:L-asparaginase